MYVRTRPEYIDIFTLINSVFSAMLIGSPVKKQQQKLISTFAKSYEYLLNRHRGSYFVQGLSSPLSYFKCIASYQSTTCHECSQQSQHH